MDTNLEILHTLLPMLDNFSKLHPNASQEEFIVWAYKQQTASKANPDFNPFHNENIVKHFFLSEKILKQSLKKVLKHYKLASIEDFFYLSFLLKYPQTSKSKLIEVHLHETPSGMEIIKRLLKLDFAIETVSPKDKRVKLLQLSAQGTALYEEVFPLVDAQYRQLLSLYTSTEKAQLLNLLKRFSPSLDL